MLLVSVTGDDGVPVTGLKKSGFSVWHLGNDANGSTSLPFNQPLEFDKLKEDQEGVYRLQLTQKFADWTSATGHHVFGVAVERPRGSVKSGLLFDRGQVVADCWAEQVHLWQYKVFTGVPVLNFENWLNQRGQESWEFVSIAPAGPAASIVSMKRLAKPVVF